jgi:hypothetical protein
MPKKIGGRGNKAPYETTTVRIPKALYSLVYKLSCEYRAKVLTDDTNNNPRLYNDKTLQEAIAESYKILKLKKGAKYSLEKLLQVLYETDIKLD